MWCIVREWNRIKINLIFFLVDLIKKDFSSFQIGVSEPNIES